MSMRVSCAGATQPGRVGVAKAGACQHTTLTCNQNLEPAGVSFTFNWVETDRKQRWVSALAQAQLTFFSLFVSVWSVLTSDLGTLQKQPFHSDRLWISWAPAGPAANWPKAPRAWQEQSGELFLSPWPSFGVQSLPDPPLGLVRMSPWQICRLPWGR